MKRFFRALLGFVIVGVSLFPVPFAQAYSQHFWNVPSPDHEQTFAFGSEQRRVWAERDRHLAVLLDFTNDPYVDSSNPRRYDNFIFAFPDVILGKDGQTFYYRSPDGRSIPVASKRPDFLGITEIHLLPNASLIVDKPHGYLSLTLLIQDHADTADSQ